jgi:hypothetical protein
MDDEGEGEGEGGDEAAMKEAEEMIMGMFGNMANHTQG